MSSNKLAHFISTAPLPSRAAVVSLLFSRSPFAVLGFVVAVIINAFDSHILGRRFSHVREKILEDCPTLANFDAAPSIVAKMRNIAIAASVEHTFPDAINAGACLSVGSVSVSRPFRTKTTTGLRISVSETANVNKSRVAAITLAEPSNMFLEVLRSLYEGPSTETSADRVNILGCMGATG